jgi:O-antigen ligase
LLLSTYIAVFEKKISDFSFVPERITLSRMMEDQGSGRLDVWKDYLNHASLKDYAMGVGFTEDHRIILYQKPLRVKVGDDQISSVALVMFEPHSAYLLVFFSVGALGFCVYLYFLFIIFKKFLHDAIIESGVHIIYMSLFLSFITWSIAGYGFIEMLTFLSLFISKTVRFNEHYKRRS